MTNIFYTKQIRGLILINIHTDFVKKYITKAGNVFTNIDSDKLKNEHTILLFEIFALAWVHKFGDKLAITQCCFI